MEIVCLDLEGVLVPEIWIAFAEETGIDELKMTTRDEPDYDVLMKKRISILREKNLTLSDIQNVIARLEPLPGAVEFMQELRSKSQVVILSDTFAEFASPLMKKLDWPTLFCNSLEVDSDDRIISHVMRQKDGKRHAIEAFRSMNLETIASGDSYNDLSMIRHADAGVLFRPPVSITEEFPDIPVARDHAELMAEIDRARAALKVKA